MQILQMSPLRVPSRKVLMHFKIFNLYESPLLLLHLIGPRSVFYALQY